MASLFAARRKHFAAARALHARAKSVGFGAAAASRLAKQSPFLVRNARWSISPATRTASSRFCG